MGPYPPAGGTPGPGAHPGAPRKWDPSAGPRDVEGGGELGERVG
jgi:hypothetical protein